MEVAERRITFAEIVDGQSNSQRFEPRQRCQRGLDVFHDRALGDLQPQAAGIEAGFHQDALDLVNQIALEKLAA